MTMHSVQRSDTPDFLKDLQAKYNSYDELCGKERSAVRDALAADFGPVCAYCERPCSPPTATADSPDEETNDHFKPLEHFPHLSLEWLNLVYSCHRCNQIKGNKWPGIKDEAINSRLTQFYPVRYVCPKEYVNSGKQYGGYTARELFKFNVDTGEISPADNLDSEEWSIAFRTIMDLDLNEFRDPCQPESERVPDRFKVPLEENDPNHLWNRRKAQLSLLIGQLNQIEDESTIISIFQQFSMPDKPFSGFIFAYFKQLIAHN